MGGIPHTTHRSTQDHQLQTAQKSAHHYHVYIKYTFPLLRARPDLQPRNVHSQAGDVDATVASSTRKHRLVSSRHILHSTAGPISCAHHQAGAIVHSRPPPPDYRRQHRPPPRFTPTGSTPGTTPHLYCNTLPTYQGNPTSSTTHVRPRACANLRSGGSSPGLDTTRRQAHCGGGPATCPAPVPHQGHTRAGS